MKLRFTNFGGIDLVFETKSGKYEGKTGAYVNGSFYSEGVAPDVLEAVILRDFVNILSQMCIP